MSNKSSDSVLDTIMSGKFSPELVILRILKSNLENPVHEVAETALLRTCRNFGISQGVCRVAIIELVGKNEVEKKVKSWNPMGTRLEFDAYTITSSGLARLSGKPAKKISDNVVYNIGNITSSNGVIQIGDNNTAFNNNAVALGALEVLSHAINQSNLPPTEKVDAKAEIVTISGQLNKRTPNASIIKLAWKGLESISTISTVTQAFHAAEQVLNQWLSG